VAGAFSKAYCEQRTVLFIDESAFYLLPGVVRTYAPELNPDEGIWQYLQHVELRNLCCPTLWDLDQEVRLAARRLRRKPQVIRACFAQAGCRSLSRPSNST
jgi:hypothetical protein